MMEKSSVSDTARSTCSWHRNIQTSLGRAAVQQGAESVGLGQRSMALWIAADVAAAVRVQSPDTVTVVHA
jgi:hypothetical protein